jgi:hypothetical protein
MDHSAAGPIGARRAGAASSYGPSEGDRLERLGRSENGQPGVNRLNDDRSLSDRGGDPFHGARADVTDSEHPGQAGLKGGAGRRGIGVVSCQDETTVVQPHGVFDPSGAGVGTDHDEEPADGPLHHAREALGGFADFNFFEPGGVPREGRRPRRYRTCTVRGAK